MTMYRYVQNAGVIVGHLLGAVAVVNVPVEDENFAGSQLVLQVLGGNGDRVEEAEAPADTREDFG